jgi:hypothetical protein
MNSIATEKIIAASVRFCLLTPTATYLDGPPD